MSRERILFVTGRLAEDSLRQVVSDLQVAASFEADVVVTKISVAALLHSDWLAKQLEFDAAKPRPDRVLLPGWCQGELTTLSNKFGVPFERGPKDLRDLPQHFGRQKSAPADLSHYSTEILAEINHAPRMADAEIVALAEHYRDSGADVVDLGCIPGETWSRAGEVTRLLVASGIRVSIDSFDRVEVESAVDAGAELVLSCNTSNATWASQLDAELVAIPDTPFGVETLEGVVDELRAAGARFRIDPILEPIGFGFAASLARYYEARRRWPDLPMMMGIGNLTELTEVDSAGLNVLFAAICEELQIGSVLTTEVINWARSSVKEFDIARRQMHYCLSQRRLPKHMDSRLVVLRDTVVHESGEGALQSLANRLKDPNYRIFAERGELHIMNRDGYWRGTNPFELFRRVRSEATETLAESHAFYLGYEISKAATALRLNKQYVQDEELIWGFLSSESNDPGHCLPAPDSDR
jgi:dihydropteroate synthase-like protein